MPDPEPPVSPDPAAVSVTGQGVRLEISVEVSDPGQRAAELLSRESGLSKLKVKDAMQKGAVWLQRTRGSAKQRKRTKPRRLRRVTATLQPGDTLHLNYDERVLSQQPLSALMVADHGEYSVWDKPAGMLCQGSRWSDHTSLQRWVEQQHAQRQVYIVHRIDRMASGLVVLAHSQAMAAALSGLFARREVHKQYRVQIYGQLTQALPFEIDSALDGKAALSRVLASSPVPARPGDSALLVEIETGRKHQIRRHLAGIGHPVIGDRLYAAERVAGEDLQLRAIVLAFAEPGTGSSRRFTLEESHDGRT